MRSIWLSLTFATAAMAQGYERLSDEQLRVYIPEGEAIEARADGDLTGDGVADIAVISYGMDNRALTVLRTQQNEVDIDFPKLGVREMDAYPQGAATLKIAKGVLIVQEMTGGTTATQATYRYRYEPAARKLRLIGIDATNYSRTNAHDGFEISWNLLTGAFLTRDMKVNKRGGDAAYDPIIEKKGKRVSKPVYLAQTPDADDVIASLRK